MTDFSEGINRGVEQSTSRTVNGSSVRIAEYPVSHELASRIQAMHDALRREFGCDYAFTISGAGNLVAASSYYHGQG